MFQPGKVAIITGIGPGMGRSIALGFARHGVEVAIAARREDRLDAVARELRALGREPLVMPLDITDRNGCGKLVAAAVKRFGGVDYLVQNGHDEGDWCLAHEANPDRWRRAFEVNFFGALNLAQEVVQTMRERGGGAMVFVNTGAAIRVPFGMGAYAASKAALASLVRSLALELGSLKIRVNGIYLGATTGETLDKAAEKAGAAQGLSAEEWMARKPAEFALRAIPAPDDCAGSVLYLCSDLAKPVTGHHVAVNGGQWVS
jgi:NAD(P)-dependent dehydrogenase (short-subunit alcohol dehydrogenase family)